MVQQPPAGAQQREQRVEVLGGALPADVLEHADGGDGVELLPAEVAVVLQPDLDLLADPGRGDPLARQVGLGGADRDADDARAVVRGGVDGHGAPAAAHVQQPHPRGAVQAQFAADQVVLGGLGVGQRHRGVGLWLPVVGGGDEPGAGVGHRLPEHQLVELVADVVVVGDRLGIAPLAVQPPALVRLLLRRLAAAAAAPPPARRRPAPARRRPLPGGRRSARPAAMCAAR